MPFDAPHAWYQLVVFMGEYFSGAARREHPVNSAGLYQADGQNTPRSACTTKRPDTGGPAGHAGAM